MKKAGILLVIMTLIFLSFACGFLFGRNNSSSEVLLSKYQQPTVATEASNTAANEAPAVININEADQAQLTTLPGIGPTLAQRIIDYREKNGDFTDPAELSNVSGIGEKRLEAILEYITVGG